MRGVNIGLHLVFDGAKLYHNNYGVKWLKLYEVIWWHGILPYSDGFFAALADGQTDVTLNVEERGASYDYVHEERAK